MPTLIFCSFLSEGLGVPPGLSVVCASQKALKVFENRKTPPSSYYISWTKWLPVMKNYEAGTPSYFATRECSSFGLVMNAPV